MMRSLTEKGPLVRRQNGFRSSLLRPVTGVALFAFVALNLFLVFRVMADSNVGPARPSPADGRIPVGGPSLEQLSEALRREGLTRIGTSSLSAKELASAIGNDRAPRQQDTSTQATGSGSTGMGSGSGGSSTGTSSTGTGTSSTGSGSTGSGGSSGGSTSEDDSGGGGPGGGGPGGGDDGGGPGGGGGGGGGGS